MARFEREAKTLATLIHHHIAHIHGFDDSTGTPALVMELVEGPTLADRIARGLIPIDETLSIAKQIADALEAAHKQGIIHQGRQYVQEEHYENHCTESLAYGGGSDFCGGLRPAQAGQPDDRYRHHQG